MPNEEIITGLKNAIARKESLEKAIQIMINSGYNAREVQEASKFIGKGVLPMMQPKPDEQLTMPEQKRGFFSKLKFWGKKSVPQSPQEQPTTQQAPQKPLTTKQSDKILQQTQHIQQPVKTQQAQPAKPAQPPQETKIIKGALTKQLENIKPKKPKHMREFILVIVLLILLIVLAVIVFFKGTIFGWFS